MNFDELFDAELIRINFPCSSKDDLFKKLSTLLFEKGYVEETFKDAIIKREAEYPTGLTTGSMQLAIPHTDVVHVKQPFIFVVKLETALPFIHMGTSDQEIEVNNIFMLGIKDPSKQVNLLSLIMDKLQDQEFIKTFISINDIKQMEAFLKNNFRSEE